MGEKNISVFLSVARHRSGCTLPYPGSEVQKSVFGALEVPPETQAALEVPPETQAGLWSPDGPGPSRRGWDGVVEHTQKIVILRFVENSGSAFSKKHALCRAMSH